MSKYVLFLLALLFSFQLIGQVNVTGNVTDEQGVPIPGANVLVKGTTKGTTTDFDGNYSIEVKEGVFLEFSYLGFKSQEIKVTTPRQGNKQILNVVLQEDTQELEAVVVTAFATQKKATVVGSVQSVAPTELKVPSANISTSFAGRMAGVISFQRGGQPGADGASFYIRGISTLSGATNPLIIVDGVQVSEGDLNAIDPEMIENFSILKDATATALYGSRGANGVMIVTTKSGDNLDKPKMNIRLETNVSQPTSIPKFVSAGDYMRMYNEAVANLSSGVTPFTTEQIYGTENNLNPYVYPNVDWYKELMTNTSYAQRLNFNVRGGGKKVIYFMNFGFVNEGGMLRNRSKEYFSFDNELSVRRYSFQNNISARLSETTKLGLRLNARMRQEQGPNADVNGIFNYVMNNNSVDFPIRYPDDGITQHVKWGGYAGSNTQSFNPLASLVSGYKENFQSTITANIELDQKLDFILPGLKFSGLGSFKNWSSTTFSRVAPYNTYSLTSYSIAPNGTYNIQTGINDSEKVVVLESRQSSAGDRKIYLQAILGYNHTFAGVHSVEAQAIYNQEDFNLNNLQGNNSYRILINSLPKRSQSLAGRVSYVYDSRYMIEFNVGHNGSENFAKNKRWGTFPSIGLGWNVSNEKFFEPLKATIQNMKLRGSWGLVGNDRIGGDRFVYLSDINLKGTGYRTGIEQNYSLSGPVYNRYANYDLTWEIAEKKNIGIDLSLFKGLNITFDMFTESRKNIFQRRGTIPTYLGTGNTVVYGNTASVNNKGFDFLVDYGKQITPSLYVAMKGTFTFARNKITQFDEPANQLYPNLINVGRRLHTHMGYVAEGLFIDQAEIDARPTQQISSNVAPGDIKYADIANRDGVKDGLINSNDRVWMGHPTVPEIVYGFGPNVKYKKWDFGIFFQGVANTSLMMSGFHPFGTNSRRSVVSYVASDYWSPTNQNIYAAYPRLTKDDHANNTTSSSFWLRDAAFLKLKNAEIGYTHNNLRIYASGVNLAIFSKFKHWDPEQGGGNGFKYPTQRVINFGIQLNIN